MRKCRQPLGRHEAIQRVIDSVIEVSSTSTGYRPFSFGINRPSEAKRRVSRDHVQPMKSSRCAAQAIELRFAIPQSKFRQLTDDRCIAADTGELSGRRDGEDGGLRTGYSPVDQWQLHVKRDSSMHRQEDKTVGGLKITNTKVEAL